LQEREEIISDATAEPQFDDAEYWKEGEGLRDRETKTKWDLGAWLIKGADVLEERIAIEKQFGGKSVPSFYVRASETIGLAPGTLRDIASTYTRAVSVRTDACTWSHHRVLVNALPKASDRELKKWLDKAAAEQMTVAALQEAIGSRQKSKSGITFKITLAKDILDALADLAYEEDIDVPTFIGRHLAEYVASDGVQLERDFARSNKKARLLAKQQKNGRRLQRSHPGKHLGN